MNRTSLLRRWMVSLPRTAPLASYSWRRRLRCVGGCATCLCRGRQGRVCFLLRSRIDHRRLDEVQKLKRSTTYGEVVDLQMTPNARRLLTQFDDSTPGWIILLLESILLSCGKAIPITRGYRLFDNGSVKRLYDTLSSSLVVPVILPFRDSTGPPNPQGVRSVAPKTCAKCKCTDGPWTWEPGTVYGSVRRCRRCFSAARTFKCG